MDVLPKTVLKIILAAKWLVRHSSTSTSPQTAGTTLAFSSVWFFFYGVWSVQEEGGGWHVPIWLMSLLTSLITFISERSSTIMGAVVPILIMAWRYEQVTQWLPQHHHGGRGAHHHHGMEVWAGYSDCYRTITGAVVPILIMAWRYELVTQWLPTQIQSKWTEGLFWCYLCDCFKDFMNNVYRQPWRERS